MNTRWIQPQTGGGGTDPGDVATGGRIGIGIGLATPGEALDVNGNIKIPIGTGTGTPPSARIFTTQKVFNVLDYGAVPNHSVDSKDAFQNALNDAGAAGGGIVYVPTGIYQISTHLAIPAHVTLEGEWQAPPTIEDLDIVTLKGTVLLAYENPSTPPTLLQTTKGSITAGSNQLTLANAIDFSNGQAICIIGAGTDSANLNTTILTGGGTTTLTLATNALTTVLNKLIRHATSGTIAINSDQLTITNALDFFSGQGICIEGAGPNQTNLFTTVSSVQGPTRLTLADRALTGVITPRTVRHHELPFIILAGSNTCVKGLTIYYPNQAVTGVPDFTHYPFCIKNDGFISNAAIINMLLVNPFNGIEFDSSSGYHFISKVYGQPLNIGIHIDDCFATGRIEHVNFWNFWSKMRYPGEFTNPNFRQVWQYQLSNAQGLILDRTDWEIVDDYCALGYHIGITLGNQNRTDKAPTGLFSNIEMDLCDIGIDIPFSIGDLGVNISNLIIQCDSNQDPSAPVYYAANRIGIRSSANNTNSLHISNAEFGMWPTNHVRWSGGRLFLNSVKFYAHGDGTYAQIAANILGGIALVSNCFFDHGFNSESPLHMAIDVAPGAQAILSGTNLDKNIHSEGIGPFVYSCINSGNVGIGTAEPAAKLEIAKLAQDTRPALRVSEGSRFIVIDPNLDATDFNPLVQAGDKAIIFSTGSPEQGALVIGQYSASSKGIRIDTGGNVGIGVTSPGSKLQVNGNAAIGYTASQTGPTNGLAVAGAVGVGVSNPTNLIETKGSLQYNTGTASRAGTTVTGVGTTFTSAMVGGVLVFNDGTTTHITAYVSATQLTVANSGTVASQSYAIYYAGFNVKSDGSTGIGTASPTAKLDVNGNIRTNGYIDVNGPRIISRAGNPTAAPAVSAPKGSLYIKTDATTTTTRLWINTNGTTGWAYFTASA
jgi:hypothetical protein